MSDMNDLLKRVRERHESALGEMGVDMHGETDMPDIDFSELAKPIRRFVIGCGLGWLTLAILGAVCGIISTALTVWVIVLVLQATGVL